MPSLKLPNLFRRDQAAPTLRERAVGLKSSLARVVRTPASDIPPEAGDEPLTVENVAALNFEAIHMPVPIRSPRQWQDRFAPHTLGLHLADRVMRMSKPELIAFIRDAGEKDADLPVLLIKQAEAARDEARTYAEMLTATAARLLAAGAAAVLTEKANSAEDSQRTAEPAFSTHREEAPQPIAVNLIDPAELASATLEDLSTLLDTADLVGSVAYAATWQGRCSVRGASHQHGAHHNVAGKLLQRLGDALTRVEYAAEREAASRVPTNPSERATRLSMLAVPTIDNDDPDVIAAFARDLADHAEAERDGR